MYKISSTTEKSPDNLSFNESPVNLQEITTREFVENFAYRIPIYIEYRQVLSPKGNLPRYISQYLLLHWMSPNSGYAAEYTRPDQIKYYRFGCKHHWKELSRQEIGERKYREMGNCYREYRCEKCGESM